MDSGSLHMTTRFTPLRLIAFRRNNVELELNVENKGNEPYWMECDVELPSSVSLSPADRVKRGRARMGIVYPGRLLTKRVKIFGGMSSYPDKYVVRMTFYGYDSKGVIAVRSDKKSYLRCEKMK